MTAEQSIEPPKKRRKLPPLDESFDVPTGKKDDPVLHQGRKRGSPHVVGQWASHIHVAIVPSDELMRVLRKAVKRVQKKKKSGDGSGGEGEIHSLLQRNGEPLHLSLSRPLMLRTNQRSDLTEGVMRLCRSVEEFQGHFAKFGVLENDEKSRRFLGIEIGSGYDQFHSLLSLIDAHLTTMRLPTYYDQPRFHISIAWSAATSLTKGEGEGLPFDEEEMERLEGELGKELRGEEVWVKEVLVRVGKDEKRVLLRTAGS